MPRVRLIACGLGLVALFGVGGCASLGPPAPPVTPAMLSHASGATVATLEMGRRVFATNCTACHHADPVTKYSAAEWRDIVADMSPRAKLDAERQAAVLSYVLAARASVLAAPQAPPAG